MDNIGSSLPSMPELASPVSMKQPPESLSVGKGHGDIGSDPALPMDKAAAQLAATLQDSVLQKMAGHSPNHNQDRLKGLTSLVLNSDQEPRSKLCTPEPPMHKGAEAPATNAAHQLSCAPHAEPELKVTIPQVVKQPSFEPSSANGTSLAVVTEGTLSAHNKRQEVKKRKGRLHKPKPPPSCGSSVVAAEPPDQTGVTEKVLFSLTVLIKSVQVNLD